MRRPLRFLLSACLLAFGAGPLAAIEYHTQAETLADPPAEGSAADPLSVVQTDDAGVPAGSIVEGFGNCCDACCDACCDGWLVGPKSWNLRAEALWMHRRKPDGTPLLADNAQMLDAGQLSFDTESGFDLSATEFNADGHGWEIRYFWLNDWTATNTLRFLNPNILTGLQITPAIPGVNDVDTTYTSKLRSGEWNYLRATKYGTIIAGFRYLEVNELLVLFSTQAVNNPILTQTTFATENDLFGFQLGYGATIYQAGPWSLEAVTKAGVFYNDAETDVDFRSNFFVGTFGADETDNAAFASEARISLSYYLADGWSIRGGLQGLYVSDIALASEQVATSGPVRPNSPIIVLQNMGTTMYWGGFLGMEYSF